MCKVESCRGADAVLLGQGVAAMAATNAMLAVIGAFLCKVVCARAASKLSLGTRLTVSAAMALVGACVVCLFCAK